MAEGCCTEAGCRRKSPILIRKGPFSGAWYAVTHYTVLKDHPQTVRSSEGGKHDITADVNQIILNTRADVLEEVVAVLDHELASLPEGHDLRRGMELSREFISQLSQEQGADIRL